MGKHAFQTRIDNLKKKLATEELSDTERAKLKKLIESYKALMSSRLNKDDVPIENIY